MTQTIDHTGRPGGNPSHSNTCACPECFGQAPKAPRPGPGDSPEERTADYARRIHWWVRLFGVAWLVTIALAVVGFAFAIGLASKDSGAGGFSSKSACMAASWTTSTECNLLFPND